MTPQDTMKTRLIGTLVSALLITTAACSPETPASREAQTTQDAALDYRGGKPGAGEPTLEEVRRLTEKYRDVRVALAEGYIRDPFDLCDTAEMMGKPASLGAMGVHYFRPDLLGVSAPPNPRVSGSGTHTDFRKPSILIYEPQADGSLELVAVENLVFQRSWWGSGKTAHPSFHGVNYDTMQDDPRTAIDEAHKFEPHYDRHVWIYRTNPNGVFAPFNPNVSCQHHKGAKMAHAGH